MSSQRICKFHNQRVLYTRLLPTSIRGDIAQWPTTINNALKGLGLKIPMTGANRAVMMDSARKNPVHVSKRPFSVHWHAGKESTARIASVAANVRQTATGSHVRAGQPVENATQTCARAVGLALTLPTAIVAPLKSAVMTTWR